MKFRVLFLASRTFQELDFQLPALQSGEVVEVLPETRLNDPWMP